MINIIIETPQNIIASEESGLCFGKYFSSINLKINVVASIDGMQAIKKNGRIKIIDGMEAIKKNGRIKISVANLSISSFYSSSGVSGIFP